MVDLRSASIGDRIVLASLPFDAMHFGARARSQANGEDVIANGSPLELMLIRVTAAARYERTIPDVLSAIDPPASQAAERRTFKLDQSKGVWRINRASYRMTDTAFSVQRGAKEIWEFQNRNPAMPHPVHVHGFQFRVLDRSASPAQVRRLATDERGLSAAELGWKDSVLLWPGETIRILMDFTHPHVGDQVYMLQCHNLEHETHGMMVNFRVAG
jgi:suppressor of ftsI/bilirubin oxidase